MEKFEMIAVRKRLGKILLVTLDASKTHEISKIELDRYGVSLGDFCYVTFDDGLIFKIHKIVKHKNGIIFKPRGPNAFGEGVFARIKKEGNNVYFESPIFGKMNSSHPIDPILFNTSQQVIVSYQDETDGINSPYKWSARIGESLESIENKMQNMNINHQQSSSYYTNSQTNCYPETAAVTQLVKNYEKMMPQLVPLHQSFGLQKPPMLKPQQMKLSQFQEPIKETRTHQIIGIVVYKLSRCYVWTKDSYPGTDVTLMTSGEDQVNVTDWICINLTKSELEKHFPLKPDENTPPFTCTSFTKLSNQILKTQIAGQSVMVTIPHLKYEGGDIRNEHLGLISDPERIINTRGVYKQIKVVRIAPRKTEREKRTVWRVISALNKIEEKKIFAKVQQNKPKEIKPKLEKNTDEKLYRGVITSIGTKNGDIKYYCWLVDEHAPSVIHDPVTEMLFGDFFESKFTKNKYGRWNHKNQSSIKRIDRLMNYEKHLNAIKFTIKVSTSDITFGKPTQIHHEYFGNISDIWNKVPDGVPDGYSIQLEIIQHKDDGKYYWVVQSCVLN